MSAPDGVVKRCQTCGRFRRYESDDTYCIGCGYQSLTGACTCGRSFDYALAEPPDGALHCPRCGRDFRAGPQTLDPA